MASGDNAAWQRLGTLLKQRRVALTREDNLAAFTRDRGATKSYRTLHDLEGARRRNFSDGMLLVVDQLYEWEPGSAAAVLAGNDPKPLPAVTVELPAARLTDRERLHLLVERISDADLARVVAVLRDVVANDPREDRPQTIEDGP